MFACMEAIMKSTRSLASVVATWTAGVIATVMAGYAAFEYVAKGQGDPVGLALMHAWHVVALTTVTYAVLFVVLRRVVVRPVRQIGSQLYRIGTGRLEPIDVPTGVTEIAALQQGVNRMIERMVLADWQADSKSNSLFPYDDEGYEQTARDQALASRGRPR